MAIQWVSDKNLCHKRLPNISDDDVGVNEESKVVHQVIDTNYEDWGPAIK